MADFQRFFPTTVGSFAGDGSELHSIIAASASYAITASYALNGGGGGGGGTIDTGSFAITGSNTFIGTQIITGSIIATGEVIGPSFQGTASNAISASYALTASLLLGSIESASYALTASYTLGSIESASHALQATSASYALTASYVLGGGGGVEYVTGSSISNLTEIEVADFDSNIAVTFVNGRLKFIFGTPTVPSAPALSFNGTFATDRFNQILDTYDLSGSFNIGAYTLISASLYEGTVLLANTGSGNILRYSTTTSGSHTYRLEVTASSPLDNSINAQSTTLTGTLSKTNPGSPTISPTPTVQLGASSNQIEQGATGSIAFTSSPGASNSWVFNSLTTTPNASPVFVTGSATGSATISIQAIASYSSSGVNGSDNNPPLTTTTSTTTTYTKIRSLRSGASVSSSFTSTELENLSGWDTTLGGNIGTVNKGTTTASGQSVTITWSGDKFHYIVYDSARPDLTNITAGGFGVFNSFTRTVVGQYKIYKTTLLQSGYSGTTITYVLT